MKKTVAILSLLFLCIIAKGQSKADVKPKLKVSDSLSLNSQATTTIDYGKLTINFDLNVTPNGIVIQVLNKEKLDGVKIYTRIQGNEEWILLAAHAGLSYTDLRPKTKTDEAETREYRVKAIVNNEEIGLESIKVITLP